MVNRERIVLETVRELLKESEVLTEMAYSKSKISKYMEDRLWQVIKHLSLCFVYKDKYQQTIHHWASEIYGILSICPLYTNTNKYPTKDQLNKWVLNDMKDVICKYIDNSIVSEKQQRKYKEVPEYNTKDIESKILKYLDWLFDNFEQRGEVTFDDIEKEIEYLQ